MIKGLDVVWYEGKIIEMGDLASGKPGLLVEARPGVYLEISGFQQHDISKMPNFLYKQVKVTIELVSANIELNGNKPTDTDCQT